MFNGRASTMRRILPFVFASGNTDSPHTDGKARFSVRKIPLPTHAANMPSWSLEGGPGIDTPDPVSCARKVAMSSSIANNLAFAGTSRRSAPKSIRPAGNESSTCRFTPDGPPQTPATSSKSTCGGAADVSTSASTTSSPSSRTYSPNGYPSNPRNNQPTAAAPAGRPASSVPSCEPRAPYA